MSEAENPILNYRSAHSDRIKYPEQGILLLFTALLFMAAKCMKIPCRIVALNRNFQTFLYRKTFEIIETFPISSYTCFKTYALWSAVCAKREALKAPFLSRLCALMCYSKCIYLMRLLYLFYPNDLHIILSDSAYVRRETVHELHAKQVRAP